MGFWSELWRMFRDGEFEPSCNIPEHKALAKRPPLPETGTANVTTPEWLRDIQIS